MSLTWKHLWDARKTRGAINVQDGSYFIQDVGHVTLQYPHETIEIPDNGRYQLDCEIDDCIVCDKCAKVCPVDCIEIEAIKSPELIRNASDGSPVRLHAAKFNIDLAKCCFCGLCTTVCPTECLTMNSEYDYSTFDVTDMNLAFSNLTKEEADAKRTLYEQFLAEKEAAKAQAKPIEKSVEAKPRPAFFPKQKPTVISTENPEDTIEAKPRPPFLPKQKPTITATELPKIEEKTEEIKEVKKPAFMPKKPSFAPSMKPKPTDGNAE